MTNEELWLTAQLVNSLGVKWIDIVPRRGPGDKILLSEDRNPNTNGARLILCSGSEPGAKLMSIAKAIQAGEIKALVVLKENRSCTWDSDRSTLATACAHRDEYLAKPGNGKAAVVLPACGFAEKRGSMVNGKGRLQRLNRATRPPGNARDDWEILRDLLQAIGGGDSAPHDRRSFPPDERSGPAIRRVES